MSVDTEQFVGEVIDEAGRMANPAWRTVREWGEAILYILFGAPWGWGVKIVAFAIVDTFLSPFLTVWGMLSYGRENLHEIGAWMGRAAVFVLLLELLRGYFGIASSAVWSVHQSQWAPFMERAAGNTTLDALCEWACFDRWWDTSRGEWVQTPPSTGSQHMPPGCERGVCSVARNASQDARVRAIVDVLLTEDRLVALVVPRVMDLIVVWFAMHAALVWFAMTWRVRAVTRLLTRAFRELEIIRGNMDFVPKEQEFQLLEIDTLAEPVFYPLPTGGYGRYVRIRGTSALLRQDVPGVAVGTGPQRRDRGLEAMQAGSSYRLSQRKYQDQLAMLSPTGLVFGRAFRVRVKRNGKYADYLVTTKHSYEQVSNEKEFIMHNEAAGLQGLYQPKQFRVASQTKGVPEIGGGDLVLLQYPNGMDSVLQLKAAELSPVVEADMFAQIWVGLGGTPMRAIGRVTGESVGAGLFHTVSTEPGISGTPLRDTMGRVIGVHQGSMEDCDNNVCNVFQDARLIEVMARSDAVWLESPNMKRKGRGARAAQEDDEVDWNATVEYPDEGEDGDVEYGQFGLAAKYRKHERRERTGEGEKQVGSKAQVREAKSKRLDSQQAELADEAIAESGDQAQGQRPSQLAVGKRSPEEVLSGLEKALDTKVSAIFAKLTALTADLDKRVMALGSSKTATEQLKSDLGDNNPKKDDGPGGSPPQGQSGVAASKAGKSRAGAKPKPKDKSQPKSGSQSSPA